MGMENIKMKIKKARKIKKKKKKKDNHVQEN